METLGKRIKEARGKLSQETFCARLGISKGALGFYERDENIPKVDVIAKICTITGVSLSWLVYGQEASLSEQNTVQKQEPLPRHEQVQPVAQGGCENCRFLQRELEKERQERRELSVEVRELYKKCLEQEHLIGELKANLRGVEVIPNASDFAPNAPSTGLHNDFQGKS